MRRNAATLIAITLLAAAILAITPSVSAEAYCSGGHNECQSASESYCQELREAGFDCSWTETDGGSDDPVTCSELEKDTCISADECDWEGGTEGYEYKLVGVSVTYCDYTARCLTGDTEISTEQAYCTYEVQRTYDRTVTCQTNNEEIDLSDLYWLASEEGEEPPCPDGWERTRSGPTCQPTNTAELGQCIESDVNDDDPITCDPEIEDCTCDELNQDQCIEEDACLREEESCSSGTKANTIDQMFTVNVSDSVEEGQELSFRILFDGNTPFTYTTQTPNEYAPDHALAEELRNTYNTVSHGHPLQLRREGTQLYFETLAETTTYNGKTVVIEEEYYTGIQVITSDSDTAQGRHEFQLTGGDDSGDCTYTCKPALCEEVGDICSGFSWNTDELECTQPQDEEQNSLCCPQGSIINESGECSVLTPQGPAHIINLTNATDDLNYYACGDHWENQQANVEYVSLCETREDAAGHIVPGRPGRFLCSVTSQGVNWTQTHVYVGHHLAEEGENINDWHVLEGVESVRHSETTDEGREALDVYADLPTTGPIICDAASPSKPSVAFGTYSPKGSGSGSCNENQCFSSGFCYEPGKVNGDYFCEQREQRAQWTSFTSVLAQEMIERVPNEQRPYVLNCGELATTTNYQGERDNLFCELAVYKSESSSSTEIDYALTGVIIKEEEPNRFITRGRDSVKELERNITLPDDWLGAEVRKLHEDFPNTVNPEADYLYYDVLPTNNPEDSERLLAIVTNKQSFDERTISLWQWIKERFTDEQITINLDLTTAEQFNLDTKFNRQAIISYEPDADLNCPEYRMMQLGEQRSCYDENQYLRYIQGR